MWVRLTRSLITYMDGVVPDAVREELAAERKWSGERTVYVNAAFVAWERARDVMASLAFTPARGRVKAMPYALAQALRKVTAATNEVIKHPALREAAMLGHHAHTFPAWQIPEDDFKRTWWPSPIEGALYAVLKPTWHDEGHRLTTWSPNGIEYRADRLNEEAVHWRVLR